MRNPALIEEMKTYRGRDEVPLDFDTFWDDEIKKLSALPDYQLKERDFHIPNVECYELTFKGTGNGIVYARVVLPKLDRRFLLFSIFMDIWAVVGIGQICLPIP